MREQDRDDAAHGAADGGGMDWRGAREVRTSDIDDQSALLRGWNQSYDQISPGPFSGRLVEARLDSLYLFREVTSTALRQTGTLEPRLCALGIPLVLEGAATFCGETCEPARLHVFSGERPFEFHSPSGLDILGLVLPLENLLGTLSDEERERIEPRLSRPGLLAAPPPVLAELATLARESLEVLGEFGAPGSMPATPGARLGDDPAVMRRLRSMERDLLCALPRALLATMPPEVETAHSAQRRAHLIHEVREYATREFGEDVPSVEDVCRALGVSRRTLQYCFQAAIGVRPATYLRAARLNGARRSIKAGESVTEAATRWGFWHFGRFAREYRLLFGELPSATVRRSAR